MTSRFLASAHSHSAHARPRGAHLQRTRPVAGAGARDIRRVRRAGIYGELVIVDDNSPDGTGQIADELARGGLPIRVVHRAGKLGLGTAVVEGFNAAEAEIVGVIDADLSHPPGLVPRMLAVMQQEHADMVIGSRYIPSGGTANWELSRVLMSKFACLMARGLTSVRDATSGFS